jgi:hypothetical protein
MGTGSLSLGENDRGVALTTHPYLAPRLRKEYSYTSTPLLGLRELFKGKIHRYASTNGMITCKDRRYR